MPEKFKSGVPPQEQKTENKETYPSEEDLEELNRKLEEGDEYEGAHADLQNDYPNFDDPRKMLDEYPAAFLEKDEDAKLEHAKRLVEKGQEHNRLAEELIGKVIEKVFASLEGSEFLLVKRAEGYQVNYKILKPGEPIPKGYSKDREIKGPEVIFSGGCAWGTNWDDFHVGNIPILGRYHDGNAGGLHGIFVDELVAIIPREFLDREDEEKLDRRTMEHWEKPSNSAMKVGRKVAEKIIRDICNKAGLPEEEVSKKLNQFLNKNE